MSIPSQSERFAPWFLTQSTLKGVIEQTPKDKVLPLQVQILQAFSKVAPVQLDRGEAVRFVASPFMEDRSSYHRIGMNDLFSRAREAYAKKLNIEAYEFHLLDNPHFAEVVDREFPSPLKEPLRVESEKNLIELLHDLADHIEENELSPEDRLVLDLTPLMTDKKLTPEAFCLFVREELEDLVLEELKDSPNALPLLRKLHLIAYAQVEEMDLLLTPAFLVEGKKDSELSQDRALQYRHARFDQQMSSLLTRSGYCLDPVRSREAIILGEGFEQTLEKDKLSFPALFNKDCTLPKVFDSWDEFLSHSVVQDFKSLGQASNSKPYLQIYPEATIALLEGLGNEGIEARLQEYPALLSMAYGRILEAMKMATLKPDHFVDFLNQIEIIHQEIQNLLAVAGLYLPGDYDETSKERWDMNDLDAPNSILTASAMHGLSTILSSIELQKGNANLKIAVQAKSYYHESVHALSPAKNHSVDVVNNLDDIQDLDDGTVDLFVGEFHHNIQNSQQVYRPEDVLDQIKTLISTGKTSKIFTAVIDNTIGSSTTKDLDPLLSDPLIKESIQNGTLNLVLLRSAQKFDMLGLDNYYGGIVSSFNDENAYQAFNERMNQEDDHLKGLPMQGLTHLYRYAEPQIQKHRSLLSQRTLHLYESLPNSLLPSNQLNQRVQISEIEDPSACFLDIKFPESPKTAEEFGLALRRYCEHHKLPFTHRSSFGFPNTNLTRIQGQRWRLCIGLENDLDLCRYAAFFQKVAKCIDLQGADDQALAKLLIQEACR